MSTEQIAELHRRAAKYAALSDPVRLRVVDILTLGDSSPSELIDELGISSNLLAHHLKVLRGAGLVTSHRSQGDGRKQYLRLVDESLAVAAPTVPPPARMLFVCTANAARSHLSAAIWRRASDIPALSAGTDPADRMAEGAIEVARRRSLVMPCIRPAAFGDVVAEGDLVVTVCDLAHEARAVPDDLHWSVPDPVRIGTPEAYDAAFDEIEARVQALTSRLAS